MPAPSQDSIENVPFESSALSFILASPSPLLSCSFLRTYPTSKPSPSSLTVRFILPSARNMERDTKLARLCLAVLFKDSCKIRKTTVFKGSGTSSSCMSIWSLILMWGYVFSKSRHNQEIVGRIPRLSNIDGLRFLETLRISSTASCAMAMMDSRDFPTSEASLLPSCIKATSALILIALTVCAIPS